MPFMKKRVYEDQAPWVNNELLSLIDRRKYLGKENRKCPCPYHQSLRDEAVKAVSKLNINLKRGYINRELEKNKDDPKRLWRTIRTLWPGNKKKSNEISCLMENVILTKFAIF